MDGRVQKILEQAVSEAGLTAAKALTIQLRHQVFLARWSENIRDVLRVEETSPGVFEIRFPLEMADEVWSWERRTHVLQRFINRIEDFAGRLYADETLRNIHEAGVI